MLKKKRQIVMVSSKVETKIVYREDIDKLWYETIRNVFLWGFKTLHVLSDEHIKNGDTYLDMLTNETYLATERPVTMKCFKKIIASTDTTLGVAKIRKSFIDIYIKAFNTGNQIKFVDVEYWVKPISEYAIGKLYPYADRRDWVLNGKGFLVNSYWLSADDGRIENNSGNGFVIDSDIKILLNVDKNNFIPIFKRKSNWNRTELDELLLSVMNLGMDLRGKQISGSSTSKSGVEVLNDWKLKNL